MSIKQVVTGLNAFIDGESFIGTASKVELSIPKPKVKETNSPGHGGTIEVPTSKWEKAEPKITLCDYPARIIGLVGSQASIDTPLRLVGTIGGNDHRTIICEVSGFWKSVEAGEWNEDTEAELSFMVSARTYRLTIDGLESIFIDYEQNIVRLNGVEQNAAINRALRG